MERDNSAHPQTPAAPGDCGHHSVGGVCVECEEKCKGAVSRSYGNLDQTRAFSGGINVHRTVGVG